MKAMVLAAGLGTRLRPLTDDRPKALVKISGRTLLDITLARLRSVGIRDVILNVHHFADMVVDFLQAHDNYGMSQSNQYVGLDVSLKETSICVIDDADKIVWRGQVDSTPEAIAAAVKQYAPHARLQRVSARGAEHDLSPLRH